MRNIVLTEPFRFAATESDRPEPGSDEALVRVRRVGVCGTDLHAYKGEQPFFDYPRIVGHALAVEIVAFSPGGDTHGAKGELKEGDLCVVNPYLNCGTCIACRKGKPNCCTRIAVLGVHTDGGMREFFTLPRGHLLAAPGLSADEMAMVENQAIGAHAVRRAAIEEGEFVLVIGAGPIGLGVVHFAALRGGRIIVMDISEERLSYCRANCPVIETLNAADDGAARVEAITAGDYPTAVFDATGNAASMNRAIEYVAHGGRLVFVGLTQEEIRFANPEFHKRELTLLGSRNAADEDFAHVMESMKTGAVRTDRLISHRATLDTVIDSFEEWIDPASGVVKAVVDLDDH